MAEVFEAVVLLFLVGIYLRLWFVARHLAELHDCFHIFEDRVFNQEHEVHVQEGSNLRVMGLEDFMDEFGFDPRNEPLDEEESANTAAIEAWDNAKL